MATLLTKDVKRETLRVCDRRGNKVIATLKAGDMLEFRVKGKKTRYEVPIASCYYLALIQYLEDEYKKKLKKYKEKQTLGLRSRKPKQPAKVFSKNWYTALKME